MKCTRQADVFCAYWVPARVMLKHMQPQTPRIRCVSRLLTMIFKQLRCILGDNYNTTRRHKHSPRVTVDHCILSTSGNVTKPVANRLWVRFIKQPDGPVVACSRRGCLSKYDIRPCRAWFRKKLKLEVFLYCSTTRDLFMVVHQQHVSPLVMGR